MCGCPAHHSSNACCTCSCDHAFKRSERALRREFEQFVPHHFEMNPATEDLVPNGRRLQNGMIVLVDSDITRGHPERISFSGSTEPNYELDQCKKANRWCKVTELSIEPPRVDQGSLVRFIGVYIDGTKTQRTYNVSYAWFVKHSRYFPIVESDGFHRDLPASSPGVCCEHSGARRSNRCCSASCCVHVCCTHITNFVEDHVDGGLLRAELRAARQRIRVLTSELGYEQSRRRTAQMELGKEVEKRLARERAERRPPRRRTDYGYTSSPYDY